MRNIVNISLTPQLNGFVEDIVATGQYASKSEFFRSLLRDWHARHLKSQLDNSKRKIEQDQGCTLKSLKDLR